TGRSVLGAKSASPRDRRGGGLAREVTRVSDRPRAVEGGPRAGAPRNGRELSTASLPQVPNRRRLRRADESSTPGVVGRQLWAQPRANDLQALSPRRRG